MRRNRTGVTPTCLTERLNRNRHLKGLEVRYGDFDTLTRQITVEDPLTEACDIYRLGRFLLGRKRPVSRPLRLLGLGGQPARTKRTAIGVALTKLGHPLS